MEKKTFKLYHGGGLMPWGAGCVVKNAKGFVWVSGCEGQDPTVSPTVEGREGFNPKVVEGRCSANEIGSGKDESQVGRDGHVIGEHGSHGYLRKGSLSRRDRSG